MLRVISSNRLEIEISQAVFSAVRKQLTKSSDRQIALLQEIAVVESHGDARIVIGNSETVVSAAAHAQ